MWFQRAFVIFALFIGKGYCQESSTTETSSFVEEPSYTFSPYTNSENYTWTTESEPTTESTTTYFEDDKSSEEILAEGEKKISETILEIIEHFKQPNPEGLPGFNVTDPYAVPDMRKAVTFFDTLYLENSFVYGLSKIKILYVNADFQGMQMNGAMFIDKLQTKGTYRYQSLLMPREGPYTVNITGLKITTKGNLGVERDGKVRTQDLNIDIAFETIAVNFENLGTIGNILQGFINNAGHFIFENIKPRILADTYAKARIEIDKKLDEMTGDVQFPNTIAPLDMVLIDVRRKVREMGYDPLKAEDHKEVLSEYASLTLNNTWVTGLSSFHRIGNMTLTMENNTVVADFEIGTQKLLGSTVWEFSVSWLVSITGTASFSVEYVSSRIIIAQPLDTRQKPTLRDFQLDVGNIQARCDGAGTIDYVLEFLVNILPNLLRYQIVGALVGPLKQKLQNELNGIDVEEEITQALPRIDKLAESGFKLSILRGTDFEDHSDEFFNF